MQTSRATTASALRYTDAEMEQILYEPVRGPGSPSVKRKGK